MVSPGAILSFKLPLDPGNVVLDEISMPIMIIMIKNIPPIKRNSFLFLLMEST